MEATEKKIVDVGAIPQGMIARFLYKRGLSTNEAEIVSTAVITIIGVILGKLLQFNVVM